MNPSSRPEGEAPQQLAGILLTVPEACAVLRISRWGLYKLIHSRQLQTVKIGSRRLIPQKSLLAFIAKLETEDHL